MIPIDGKKIYGAEYPAAIVHDGIRMPLRNESRFSRDYSCDERKLIVRNSRFADGSASITASELEHDWATWTKDLQIEFCHELRYLFDQSDFSEMLHFVMRHGSSAHWAAIALTVAHELPQQEAFDFLVRALHVTKDNASAANMTQGIAQTKYPDAEAVLRSHLAATWSHSNLWGNAADAMNWIAYDATACIAHLIEVGASPADFSEQAQRLSQHVCSRNRNSCRSYLSKHYPEINYSN